VKTGNAAARAAQTGNGGENAGKNGTIAGTLMNSLPAYDFASFRTRGTTAEMFQLRQRATERGQHGLTRIVRSDKIGLAAKQRTFNNSDNKFKK
jgi:hypothetical protein